MSDNLLESVAGYLVHFGHGLSQNMDKKKLGDDCDCEGAEKLVAEEQQNY
jgi:hypothetical protein